MSKLKEYFLALYGCNLNENIKESFLLNNNL